MNGKEWCIGPRADEQDIPADLQWIDGGGSYAPTRRGATFSATLEARDGEMWIRIPAAVVEALELHEGMSIELRIVASKAPE